MRALHDLRKCTKVVHIGILIVTMHDWDIPTIYMRASHEWAVAQALEGKDNKHRGATLLAHILWQAATTRCRSLTTCRVDA